MNRSTHDSVADPTAGLSDEQREQLRLYQRYLLELNRRVNLISRQDESEVPTRHTLHSLAISMRSFPNGSQVVDWGTGGGLPGLPLAIRFPDVQFHLVDATRKKVFAVRSIVRRLELENVEVCHSRADEWSGKVQYSVSRATADLDQLWRWHERVYHPVSEGNSDHSSSWNEGLLTLKGGDLTDEVGAVRAEFPQVEILQIELRPYLEDPFFREKKLVHVSEAS